jgi:hypothetical protein
MSTSWHEAATLYRMAQQRKIEEADRLRMSTPSIKYPPALINAAINEFTEFLSNETWESAMSLLEASGQEIILGIDYLGHAYCKIYALTCHGLIRRQEAVGAWAALTTHIKKPYSECINAREMIVAAVHPHVGKMKPNEVVPWIKSALDKIAQNAPKPEAAFNAA